MWISVSRIAKLTLQHFRVILLPQNTETKQITHIEAEENALLFAIVKHLHIFLDSHAQFLKTEQRPRPTGDNFRTLECWNRTDQLNLPFLALSSFGLWWVKKNEKEEITHGCILLFSHSQAVEACVKLGIIEGIRPTQSALAHGDTRRIEHALSGGLSFFFLGNTIICAVCTVIYKVSRNFKSQG